jgi:septum formation topological specificity factor MinE
LENWKRQKSMQTTEERVGIVVAAQKKIGSEQEEFITWRHEILSII